MLSQATARQGSQWSGTFRASPLYKHTKCYEIWHTKQRQLTTQSLMSFSEQKPLNRSTMMNKSRCQGKHRGGLRRMMREHKARLYIIRRCIVMLLCHKDWSVISVFCSSERTPVFSFWSLTRYSECKQFFDVYIEGIFDSFRQFFFFSLISDQCVLFEWKDASFVLVSFSEFSVLVWTILWCVYWVDM